MLSFDFAQDKIIDGEFTEPEPFLRGKMDIFTYQI